MKKHCSSRCSSLAPALVLVGRAESQLRSERPDACRPGPPGLERADRPERAGSRPTTGGLDRPAIMQAAVG